MPDSHEPNSSPSSLSDIQRQCNQDSEAWFGMGEACDAHITFMLLALGGEIGEVQNVWKKYLRGSITREQALSMLEDELADVFTYLMNLPELVGFDMEEEYNVKRKYNAGRFGTNPE